MTCNVVVARRTDAGDQKTKHWFLLTAFGRFRRDLKHSATSIHVSAVFCMVTYSITTVILICASRHNRWDELNATIDCCNVQCKYVQEMRKERQKAVVVRFLDDDVKSILFMRATAKLERLASCRKHTM